MGGGSIDRCCFRIINRNHVVILGGCGGSSIDRCCFGSINRNHVVILGGWGGSSIGRCCFGSINRNHVVILGGWGGGSIDRCCFGSINRNHVVILGGWVVVVVLTVTASVFSIRLFIVVVVNHQKSQAMTFHSVGVAVWRLDSSLNDLPNCRLCLQHQPEMFGRLLTALVVLILSCQLKSL